MKPNIISIVLFSVLIVFIGGGLIFVGNEGSVVLPLGELILGGGLVFGSYLQLRHLPPLRKPYTLDPNFNNYFILLLFICGGTCFFIVGIIRALQIIVK